MAVSWDRLGPLYAKLGIATSASLIEARKAAAQAGYVAFKRPHLGGAVRCALGLGVTPDVVPLFTAMRAKDPTLDLELTDKEAQLLLGAIVAAEMSEGTGLGGLAALGVVTGSFGGVRQSSVDPGLVAAAEQSLANLQMASGGQSSNLVVAKRPDDVTAAIEALAPLNTNYGQTLTAASVTAAIQKLAEYVDSAHTAAATQAKVAIAYSRRLEEELRTYWWVVGGWSDQLGKPFKALGQSDAALRAGVELAEKTTLPLGLFAAPALLDKVIRQDRKARLTKPAVGDAVKEVDENWRKGRQKVAATGSGDLLPLSLALELSAESGDADDWRPRFKRLTGIDAGSAMGPLDTALQIYREILFGRALAAPSK